MESGNYVASMVFEPSQPQSGLKQLGRSHTGTRGIVRGEHDDRTMLKSDRIPLRPGTLQRVGFTADRRQLVAGIGTQAAKIQFRVVSDPAQRYAV
jgi:hypothetical protein